MSSEEANQSPSGFIPQRHQHLWPKTCHAKETESKAVKGKHSQGRREEGLMEGRGRRAKRESGKEMRERKERGRKGKRDRREEKWGG